MLERGMLINQTSGRSFILAFLVFFLIFILNVD